VPAEVGIQSLAKGWMPTSAGTSGWWGTRAAARAHLPRFRSPAIPA